MAKSTTTSKVKGGRIARDAKSGRFVSVETPDGVSRQSAKSAAAVKEVSAKRSAALRRLADR